MTSSLHFVKIWYLCLSLYLLVYGLLLFTCIYLTILHSPFQSVKSDLILLPFSHFQMLWKRHFSHSPAFPKTLNIFILIEIEPYDFIMVHKAGERVGDSEHIIDIIIQN